MRVIGNNVDTPYEINIPNNSGSVIYDGRVLVMEEDGTLNYHNESKTQAAGSVSTISTYAKDESNYWNKKSIIYIPRDNKIVVSYNTQQGGQNDTLKYRVGTVNYDNSFTWGTENTIVSPGQAPAFAELCYDPDQNSIFCVYQKGNGNYGLACKAGTLSGTTITWGNELDLDTTTASGGCSDCTVAYSDSARQMLVVYSNNSNNHTRAIPVTISGNVCTAQSYYPIVSPATQHPVLTFDKYYKRFVLAGFNDSSAQVFSKGISLQGFTIQLGSTNGFSQGVNSTGQLSGKFCEGTGSHCFTYVSSDVGSSGQGETLTVKFVDSGGGFGGSESLETIQSIATFHSAATAYLSTAWDTSVSSGTYQGMFQMFYTDDADSDKLKVVGCEVNENSVGNGPTTTNFTNEFTLYDTHPVQHPGAACHIDPLGKSVVVFIVSSQVLYALAYQSSDTHTLTRDNYIGVAKGNSINGQRVKIITRGGVTPVSSSSNYKVGENYNVYGHVQDPQEIAGNGQTDYSLNRPSVPVGTAISTFQMLIKV